MALAPSPAADRKNSLSDACRALSAAVHNRYPALEICFLTMKDTSLTAETIALSLKDNADKNTLSLLERHIAGRFVAEGINSQGLIFARETAGSALRILAPITVIRPPHYMTETLLFELYGAIWHVLNRLDTVFDGDGRLLVNTPYLAPDLAPTALIRHTLKADLFASLMLHVWHACPESDRFLRSRALDALTMKERHRPEEYPSFLALDALLHVMSSSPRSLSSLGNMIDWAKTMADDINLVITDDSLAIWVQFATSAQDLAWRGFDTETIIRAAMNAAHDPHIRALAFQLSETLGLSPDKGGDVPDPVNSFMTARQEGNAHFDHMRLVFENTLDRVLQSGNSDAFYEKAAEQNYALLSGSVLGWCAYGLQCAARSYDIALHRGNSPVLAARLEFEAICKQTDWQTLTRLGDLVLEAIRMRIHVDLRSIAQFCQTANDMNAIVESVDITLNETRYKSEAIQGNEGDQKMMAPGMRAFRGSGSESYSLRAALSFSGFDHNRRAQS